MVAVISINAYYFLGFSDLTCHIEDTGIGVFCTVPPDSKETKVGSSNLDKNTGIVLMLCCTWKCVPFLFLVVWIFLRFLVIICYDR